MSSDRTLVVVGGWPATPMTRRTWPAICAGTGSTW